MSFLYLKTTLLLLVTFSAFHQRLWSALQHQCGHTFNASVVRKSWNIFCIPLKWSAWTACTTSVPALFIIRSCVIIALTISRISSFWRIKSADHCRKSRAMKMRPILICRNTCGSIFLCSTAAESASDKS